MPWEAPIAPVAVDTMGGDHAPEAIIAGAVAAVRDHGVRLVLVGQAPRIRDLLERHGAAGVIPIVNAEEALEMDEGALASWRKPRSSIAIACRLIKQGRASALVSAGSTAGIVATARLRLRGQHGVTRPAIAVTLPTRPRPTVLLDAGATVDPKPETLAQFAGLGVAYAQVALGVARPRLGLLNIGSEPGKGNKLARRAFELLSASPPSLRAAVPGEKSPPGAEFIGNIEGDDLLTGLVDVIVTDGFSGNVALKTMEGAVRMMAAELRAAVGSTRRAKLGAALQRRPLREMRERFSSDTYGGGVLLGLNGTVVIAHGASNALAITSACRLAHQLATGQIVERIRDQVVGPRTSRFGRRNSGDQSRSGTERTDETRGSEERIAEPFVPKEDPPDAGETPAPPPANK
jgi:glycerol-3-phosphate acyltransferase PlsX